MATHVRSRGVQTQPSAALRLKCGRELRKLRAKLEDQLCRDISRCFEEQLHPDLTLVASEEEITVHRAILRIRTPFLYRELKLVNSCENHRIPIPNISCQLLKSLLRKIYSENSIDEEEATLVALLRQDKTKGLQSEETDSDNLQPSSGASSPYKMDGAETDGEGNEMCLESSHNNNEGEEMMSKTLLHKSAICQRVSTENGHDSDVSTSTPTASENIHDICASTDFVHVVENVACDEATNRALEDVNNSNGDDKGDNSGVESESSDEKSRTLIRRDTFDLIDPAIAEDDTQKEDDDDDDDEEELVIIKMDDVNPRVVWEVGGEALRKEKSNYEDLGGHNKNYDDNDDVMIASTQAVSSGSDHNPFSTETTTKDDTMNGMSVSISTEAGGISLSNSFTATMYDSADAEHLMPAVLHGNDLLESTEEPKAAQTDTTSTAWSQSQNIWPKDSLVLSPNADKNSERPKPDEIIYLDQLSPFVDKKSLSLDCNPTSLKRRSNTVDSLVDLHANYESSMKHSNSKLFSPDSIISDRSPMLEKAGCFTHNTVQILPILTDYETVGVTTDVPSRCPVRPKKYSLSRRSSESLSPEADSLTLETTLQNGLALTASPVANINPLLNGSLQPRTPSADKLGAHLEALESRSIVAGTKSKKGKCGTVVSKSLESVPIVSGFSDAHVAKAPEEKKSSEIQSTKGSFFVFIDVGDGTKKTLEPPKAGDCRHRITSGTSEDESLSVNKSLSLDTSRKDSASEDDTHSERSPKLGTSPKAPPSVYMFIESGTSPKDAPSVRRSHHVRRASMSDYSSSPTTRGHVRRLSQGREFVIPPPKSFSADEHEKPKSIKSQETKPEKLNGESVQSPEPDDDIETIYSEFSDYISHERSNSVSGVSPDDDEGRVPCSKLGEDLLRMFLEEINTDVVVRVSGRDIKAHKCILASRCSYFAAMLSGGWLESSGNIINLQGFTYLAVHFALCHIYSGATTIPKEVDISELASLADMLGLEGLRDVVALTLKAKYCHFFHKPCSSCIAGVVECLPLCADYGLEELYDKSIRWLTRHMARTWPNKAFASLPDELLNKCYRAAKAEIGVQSVLDMIMTCDKLMATLPHVKWSEPVFNLCTKLLEASTLFLAKNLHMVLTSKSFLALGKGQSWNVNALEDTIMMALENLTPDGACSSYVALAQLLGSGEYSIDAEDSEVIENFVELLQKIQRQVERYLIHNANRVVHCPSWAKLTPPMQKRIKDAAVIVFEFGKPTAPPPRLSSLNRRFNRGKTHSPAEHSESSTTSSSSGRTTGSKKPARGAAMPIPKPSNRPLTAPLSGSSPSLHSKQSGAKKLTMDLPQRCLTPNKDAARRSPSAAVMDRPCGSLATSLSPRTNRLSDLPGAQLRKSASRDRVVNARPKSWPNKEKMTHPTKTKVDVPKESVKSSNVTLRTASRPPPKTGTNSRPRSAVYSSETSSENTAKPCRTFASSSLRETKSSASKRITSTESMDSPNKSKLVDKSSRSHASTVKKSHTREDSKLHTTRRTTERAGIKVSVGNKG